MENSALKINGEARKPAQQKFVHDKIIGALQCMKPDRSNKIDKVFIYYVFGEFVFKLVRALL